MSLFEKVFILGSLGAVGAFSAYQVLKPEGGSLTTAEVEAKREEILRDENMRILYSSMTFLYLQGFEQENLQSFFRLYDILEISKPKLVAIQLSEEEYRDVYLRVIENTQFPAVMKRVEQMLENHDENLKNIKEIELENLEKLYLIDYCKKNKCKVLFADQAPTELQREYEAKLRLEELTREKQDIVSEHLEDLYDNKEQEGDKREAKLILDKSEEEIKREIFVKKRGDFFVQTLVDELRPKYTFMPSNPYKTIVGLVDPNQVSYISRQWKNTFKATYGHDITEDETVEHAADDNDDEENENKESAVTNVTK